MCIRDRYIIVPYDDEIKLTTATEEEKVEYMKSELENRCQLIINGLSRLGVRAKTLNDNEDVYKRQLLPDQGPYRPCLR